MALRIARCQPALHSAALQRPEICQLYASTACLTAAAGGLCCTDSRLSEPALTLRQLCADDRHLPRSVPGCGLSTALPARHRPAATG